MTPSTFHFSLEKTRGKARAGKIMTPHGEVLTPLFMPVGTLGSVKSLDSQDITQTQAQIILGNTYHLYLRPGMEVMEQAGGLHQFMGWHQPILTDSGGFQVYSLAGRTAQGTNNSRRSQVLSQVSDKGVQFTSHYDGSQHFFTPEKSIDIQRTIGSDIMMAFDECITDTSSRSSHEKAVERTAQWATACVYEWQAHQRLSKYGLYQALFGIIQGGTDKELRKMSTEQIVSLGFDGIAVGGETVGYNMPGTAEIMSWIEPHLPADKPRYAMGLGRDPEDILAAVLMGFDMFDCVGPTRLARNGALYSGTLDLSGEAPRFISAYPHGRLNIERSEYAADFTILSPDCSCATCRYGYTRAYLHHLYRTKELTYYRLASIHNVTAMISWVTQLRNWILQ